MRPAYIWFSCLFVSVSLDHKMRLEWTSGDHLLQYLAHSSVTYMIIPAYPWLYPVRSRKYPSVEAASVHIFHYNLSPFCFHFCPLCLILPLCNPEAGPIVSVTHPVGTKRQPPSKAVRSPEWTSLWSLLFNHFCPLTSLKLINIFLLLGYPNHPQYLDVV